MKNKKLIMLSLAALLIMSLVAGCGSNEKQANKAAAPATAKSASSMPNEDPMPIVQDLERKMKDTGAMAKEGKWAEAKLIAAEALKTNDRLTVHVTDARLKDSLKKSVSEVNAAVTASPVDQKAAETKVLAALELIKQASVQMQGHQHH